MMLRLACKARMKSCPFWAHNVPARIDYLAIDEHTTGQTGTHNVKKHTINITNHVCVWL